MQPPQGPYSDYQNYPPQQPQQPQWTQIPPPGQGGGSSQAPGQVPPPAQIMPPPMGNQPPSPQGQIPYGNQPMPPQGQNPYGNPPMPPQGQNPYGNPPMPPQGQMPYGNPPMPPQGQMPYGGSQQMPQMPQQPGSQGSGFYKVPKTGMPRPQKKKGKGVYIALAVVVVVFAVVAVLGMLSPGQVAYGYVQSGSLSARYTGDAIIVRDEIVSAQEGVSHIDYHPHEGDKITRGTNVATIYTSGFSNKEWVTLDNYRTQIKDYQKILIDEATADTKLMSLMTKVRERGMETQRLVQGAPGSLVNQEILLEQAMEERQRYLRKKYTDDQKLTRLYDDEKTQLQRISTWSKQYAASQDGQVSFYTDGFEAALNMNNYMNYSPAQVRSMYNGNIPQTGEKRSRNTKDIYRLVKQNPWAVLMLCNEMEWTPVAGRTYKLLIETFKNTVVDATVESFTRSGGELLVRLKIDNVGALEEVLYLRSCQVLLGESVDSLMVPSRAIYIREGRKGVIMATEGGEYWTGVEVISDDGNVAYVIPENPGVLYDGIRIRLF